MALMSNWRGEYGGCGMVPLTLRRFARQSSNSKKAVSCCFFEWGTDKNPI